MIKWKNYRKTAVAVAGVAAQFVNSGALHGSAQVYGSALLALLTAAGVYSVPNSVPAFQVLPVAPPVPPQAPVPTIS